MNSTKPEISLEERLRGAIRLRHYSRQTEETYVQWYKRYVLFQKEAGGVMRHPAEMGAAEVEAFLTHLAVNRDLSASSQKRSGPPGRGSGGVFAARDGGEESQCGGKLAVVLVFSLGAGV